MDDKYPNPLFKQYIGFRNYRKKKETIYKNWR